MPKITKYSRTVGAVRKTPTESVRRLCGIFYRDHHERVFDLCLFLVKDREQAWDLGQEAFLKAMVHWDDFQQRSQRLTGLLAIARNACLTHLRSRKHRLIRHEEMERAVDSRPPECNPEEKWISGIVFDRTLGRVNFRTRTILTKYYRHCFNHEEIAQDLGLSRAAVSKALLKVKAWWALECPMRTFPGIEPKVRHVGIRRRTPGY